MNSNLHALAIVALLSFASCSSTSRVSGGSEAVPRAASGGSVSSSWHLVGKDPPTYFPKGVPADAPTSFRDGEWVYAGENGERWFIPKTGIDAGKRAQLRDEALGRRTADQWKEIAQKSTKQSNADFARVVMVTPVALLAMMGTGGWGGYSSLEDLE